MSLPVYPSVSPGAIQARSPTWPLEADEQWSTVIHEVSSGKENRLAFWTVPRRMFTIDYNYLLDNPGDILAGNTYTDLQTVVGLHMQLQGAAGVCLFDFPENDTVTTQNFGTGDGTTVSFQLVANYGGYLEPIQAPAGVTSAPVFSGGSAPLIYNNGTLVSSSNYSIGDVGYGGGIVTFNTAPLSGHALTWSGNFYYPVRFMEDKLDPSEFIPQFWELKKVQLIQVKY